MRIPSRLYPCLWVIVPLCALAFFLWSTQRRLERLDYVSNLAKTEAPAAAKQDPTTSPGVVRRDLIVPERNEASFEWLIQTEQMIRQHTLRVRQANYDGAPLGREVWATSPYRWWLGAWSWADRKIADSELTQSVQRAARYAEPGLLGLVLMVGAFFVARRFGGFSAALFSVGIVSFFPFAAGFLPGVPDHHGWARVCALVSGLLLTSALNSRNESPGFVAAGVLSGIAVWFDVPTGVQFIVGTSLGGVGAAMILRRTNEAGMVLGVPGWRWWSFSGAMTIAAAYFVEYAPDHLGEWHLEYIHPLYAIAWIGLGEIVEAAWKFARRDPISWKAGASRLVIAFLAVASVPIVMHWTGSQGYLKRDLFAFRLTNQAAGIVSRSFWNWISHDGLTGAVCATVVPLLLLVPAFVGLRKAGTAAPQRAQILLVLGVTAMMLGWATQQISWWSNVQIGLLTLLVVVTGKTASEPTSARRGRWCAASAFIAIFGLVQLWPRGSADVTLALTPSETEELVERDLAHWLSQRTGESGAVVFAPPHPTLTLAFFGGLRGIGTFSPDNKEGFGESLTIAGANTMEEVQAQLQAKGVRYIVVPSWDPYFEEFGRLYLAAKFSNRKSLLIEELKRWNLPLWLRPLAYPMPVIPGFEKQSVRVFEVVDAQKPAIAMSRLGEYLADMGDLDQASAIRESLKRFPGDVSALVARAQIARAQGAESDFAADLQQILSRTQGGGDRYLVWDRRVALAVTLAQGGRIDQARDQTRQCIKEIDLDKVRALSSGSLYQLIVLCDEFKMEFGSPALRVEALDLLPAELHRRL